MRVLTSLCCTPRNYIRVLTGLETRTFTHNHCLKMHRLQAVMHLFARIYSLISYFGEKLCYVKFSFHFTCREAFLLAALRYIAIIYNTFHCMKCYVRVTAPDISRAMFVFGYYWTRKAPRILNVIPTAVISVESNK
jgi:hypothetical protein